MKTRIPTLAAAALLAALALPRAADAYVYWGNPKLKVSLSRTEADLDSASGDLSVLRVYHCGGGYDDYAVDAVIDPVAGWETTIDGGDLCGAALRWDSDVLLTKSGSFQLRYEQLTTQVTFDGTGAGEADYDPFVVDQGTFSGSTPVFTVWLE